jgi:exo-beta-1,3-glucanase (GH17 family)
MPADRFDVATGALGTNRLSRRRALGTTAAGLAMAGMAASGLGRAATAHQATPEPADGDVLTAVQTSRAWINYGPARPFDFAIGEHPVTEDQLQMEMEMLFDVGFRGIVTNAVTYGLEAMPRIAKEVGFQHVITKLWWASDDLLEVEKANVAAAIDDIDAIVVGNEMVHKAIFRAEEGDAALERLRTEITSMQEAYGKPVSTGLHRDEWILYPEMATELGDFTFPNLQPWWAMARNDPETAAQWAIGAYELILNTPGMPADRVVVAQEAAFPSGAVPPESAPGATPEHQAVFYERLIESGIPFVYGFSFDQWYARETSPPGGFGGLWDDERQPKPVVDVLDLGPYA